MRAARSLRGRVALLATLAVAAVLLLVGATAVASFAEREHARVDDELAARPLGALVRALAGSDRPPLAGSGRRALPPPGGQELPAPPPTVEGPGLGPQALRPEGEYIRLIDGS